MDSWTGYCGDGFVKNTFSNWKEGAPNGKGKLCLMRNLSQPFTGSNGIAVETSGERELRFSLKAFIWYYIIIQYPGIVSTLTLSHPSIRQSTLQSFQLLYLF